MKRYAVQVTYESGKYDFLKNDGIMGEQVYSSGADLVKDGTFETVAEASKAIAMFAHKYNSLAERWGFEIVSVTTVDPMIAPLE